MKKWSMLVLLTSLLFGCGSQQVDSVKIGFIGPLTGDAANYGKMMSQAIKIAVEEKNQAGGIAGKKVVLVAEDSEGKPDKANAAIEKLAGIDKVWGIVGAVFSSASLAIAPKANAAKIVMISPSSTHKDLTSKGKFIFRTVVTDALQAKVFGHYVYEVAGIKTVAVLYIKNDYSQGLAEDFKSTYEAAGGKVVAMETGMQGDKDFTTQLTKIKSLNPEALYIPDYIAEMAQILEQAKQLGLNVKILSSDGFSNPEIFELAGDAANGVLFSNAAENKENSKIKSDFEKKYTEKWGQKPDAFSLNSYDAANILINAIETVYNQSSPAVQKTFKLDRNAIQAVVAATKNYNGVSGKITFAENGDLIKNMGIYKSANNKYTQIGVYTLNDNKLVEVK